MTRPARSASRPPSEPSLTAASAPEPNPDAAQDAARERALARERRLREAAERRIEALEAALGDSEHRIQDFARIASGWLWEMDEELRFTRLDGVFTEATTLAKEDVIGHTLTEIGVAGYDDETTARQGATFRERKPFRDSIGKALGRDGRIHYIRVSGRPSFDDAGEFLGYRGVALDITPMIESKHEAERIHQRLEEALEAFPDGFALFDAEDRLVLCNTKYIEIYAASAPAIVPGARFEDIVRYGVERGQYPAAIGREEEWLQERLEQHRTLEGTVMQELADGRWLRISENTTREGGRVGVRSDVTELKRAEEERAELQGRLFQAQKMEAIGTLAGGIAHDFNNILAIVLGHAEILALDLPEDSEELEAVQEIVTAGRRAKSLIQQILTFSRRSDQVIEPLIVDRVLAECIKMLRSTLPTQIEIRYRADASDAMVMGDPTQLHQVVMNLCVNSSHAIGERPGTIDIRLDAVEIDGGRAEGLREEIGDNRIVRIESAEEPGPGRHRMWIGLLEKGSHVRISVHDSGGGMERRTLERAFDPFFTTKDVGRGTGLGLAAVHGIVESHKGAIMVDTAPGQGTEIQIFLPTIAPELRPRGCGPEDILPADRRLARILVVDDERAIVRMMEKTLRGAGHIVTGLTDSVEALAVFKAAPNAFDLVITDHAMPEQTGLALATRMLDIRPELPILLCTGNTEAVSRSDAAATGIAAFLTKPVVGQELIDAVEHALRKAAAAKGTS
jgi:PAS domain S-box-containing protein